jgi:hypothetical protein
LLRQDPAHESNYDKDRSNRNKGKTGFALVVSMMEIRRAARHYGRESLVILECGARWSSISIVTFDLRAIEVEEPERLDWPVTYVSFCLLLKNADAVRKGRLVPPYF